MLAALTASSGVSFNPHNKRFSMYGLMHLSDTSQLLDATRINRMFTRHKRGGLATWLCVQTGQPGCILKGLQQQNQQQLQKEQFL
nr:hypothetical protein [Tanacetum cinerariifolium]